MEFQSTFPADPVAELLSGSLPAQLAIGAFVVLAVLFAIILIQPQRTHAIVTQVFVYPIKSCGGVEVKSAAFSPEGFEGDRRFMVVRAEADRPDTFMHQRVLPRMALIHPTNTADGGLVIRTDDGREMELELIRPEDDGAQFRTVRVWDSVVKDTVDQGDEVADFLSSFLDTPDLRLVHMPTNCKRMVPKRFLAPSAKNTVSFADGFPFLVLSEESMTELAQRVSDPSIADVRRFRPNIVVRGAWRPNDEDSWKEFKVNGHTMYGVKKCTRCKIPTINPDDASGIGPDEEPLVAMRNYRLQKDGTSVLMGLNATPQWRRKKGTPTISVGDPVVVEALTHSMDYK